MSECKCCLTLQVVLDHTDKPGVRDRQNFNLHWSVDYWQNFTLPPAIEDSGDAPIPSRYGRHATQAVDTVPRMGRSS